MSDDPIDLFASLRPDDETLAASDRDAIWTRLTGQPAPSGSTDMIDIVDARAEAGRRRRVLAIAAAAAMVLAVLVVATRRDAATDRGGSTPATTAPTTFRPTTTGATGPPTTSLLTAPPTDPASNGATTLPSFTADPTVPLTPDAVPWYLPTWLPDGTELWVVHSQPVIDPGFGILSQAHWVKRGPDGRTVVADVHLYVSEGGADDAGSNATVHGAPGRVVRSSSDHRSASVSWNEGQHSWELSAQGIDGDALLRIAEASTVHSDTSTLTVEESSGLETVPAPTSAASTAMGSSTTAGRYGSGRLDQWVNIRVEAARAGETLDDTSGVESRRVTIDGIERSIVDDPPDGASLGHRVRWYADGHVVTVLVKRRLDRADLQRLISGIHPASAGEVDAARGVVSASGLAAPVVDSATTADGTVVSIRGASGGVHYACASIDDRSGCVVGSETRHLDGGGADAIAPTTVLVGDQVVVVGWRTAQSPRPLGAPGQDALVDITGGTGATFSFARRPVGRIDPFFPAASGETWDEFWAPPGNDPLAVSTPWLRAAMADSRGRITTVRGSRSYDEARELRAPARAPRMSIDAAVTAAGSQVRDSVAGASNVTILFGALAATSDPPGDDPTARLVYVLSFRLEGCYPSTATTAPPGVTSPPTACQVHLMIDADIGSYVERWEQFEPS